MHPLLSILDSPHIVPLHLDIKVVLLPTSKMSAFLVEDDRITMRIMAVASRAGPGVCFGDGVIDYHWGHSSYCPPHLSCGLRL